MITVTMMFFSLRLAFSAILAVIDLNPVSAIHLSSPVTKAELAAVLGSPSAAAAPVLITSKATDRKQVLTVTKIEPINISITPLAPKLKHEKAWVVALKLLRQLGALCIVS